MGIKGNKIVRNGTCWDVTNNLLARLRDIVSILTNKKIFIAILRNWITFYCNVHDG